MFTQVLLIALSLIPAGASTGFTDHRGREILKTNVCGAGTYADVKSGVPYVNVDTCSLSKLPRVVATWVQLHEVSHHLLGHLDLPKITKLEEAQADCLALSLMKHHGDLSKAKLERLGTYLTKIPGDATHEPGPIRFLNALGCSLLLTGDSK